MDKANTIKEKSLRFAVKVVKHGKELQNRHKEYILSKQFIRSGTAIGALIREADEAESKRDFIHKLAIALKEASETEYWLILLRESEYLNDEKLYKELIGSNKELIRMLTAIIRTSRKSIGIKLH